MTRLEIPAGNTMSMSQRLPRTMQILQDGIDAGLHLGAQLYVWHADQVLADTALGESRPGVPMTVDTINMWMSSGKPVSAIAALQLWERRLLDLDDPVAKHLPDFGARGKESITIRHLLTHTGGFRAVIGLRWADSLADAIAKINQSALEPRWVVGETAGYHTASSWYVLAALVQRLDGRDFQRYVHEAIFEPAGMADCWIGIPEANYAEYGQRIGLLYEMGGAAPQPVEPGSSAADAAAVRPGANARGPIRGLGRLYEALLRKSGELLTPQTIEAMTARHRTGVYDLTFKHVMDMGLGVIVNSNLYGAETVPYGYGPLAGPRTYGHSGQQSSCGFCDPDRRLIVAWMCNGMPTPQLHARRQYQINQAIYQDLQSA
jgi:CubicO group peptidase (beta-lactamase class C family)